MSTIGRTGDILEGTFQVPGPGYPDPATQDVNCHPVDWAYGVGNEQFDRTAPSVPTGFSSTAHTANSVTLAWGASTDNFGVDHYNIYVGGTKSGTTKNLSAVVSGLTGATAYNFRVTAVDQFGNESALSSNVAVTTS